MGLIDVAREVKSGKKKLADVPDGVRLAVQRLIPVAGEAPRPGAERTDRLSPSFRFRKAHTG